MTLVPAQSPRLRVSQAPTSLWDLHNTPPRSSVGASLQRSFWTAYLAHLRLPEAGEADSFADLIQAVMVLLGNDEALCDEFSVSRITLKRWAAGVTTPGPMARDSVLRRLERLAETFADSPQVPA